MSENVSWDLAGFKRPAICRIKAVELKLFRPKLKNCVRMAEYFCYTSDKAYLKQIHIKPEF